jgi:hypothetical protein
MNRRTFLAAVSATAALPLIAKAQVLPGDTAPSSPPAPRTLTPDPNGTPLPADLCAAVRRLPVGRADWSGATLSLGGHAWNLFPEETVETVIFPGNNDLGVVKTPLLLENLRDVTIDGGGASLRVRGTPQAGKGNMAVLHPPIVPVVMRNCTNVVLRNFSIDWATPAIIQGRCVASDRTTGVFDVEFEEGRGLWCWNGQLYAEGEGWTWPVMRLLMVDPETGAMKPGSGDNMNAGFEVNWQTEKLSERVIRFRGPTTAQHEVGAMILAWCTTYHTGARRAPALFIEGCRNVHVENVTLHHCWAMGLIAQDSTDLTLTRMVVEPSGDRKYSLAADATHFINCRGKLTFDGCRFQNQFDDGINTHGLYQQVVRRVDAHTLRVRVVHPQHAGVKTHRAGDTVRLCHTGAMLPVAELVLAGVERLNSEMQDLRFSAPIPDSLVTGDFIENTSAYPEISIRGCTFRWNRARGVLVNGRGPVRIEGNSFETAGSAIMVESSGLWGEAGPIDKLEIRNNVFRKCSHVGAWGSSVIHASPEFRKHQAVPAGAKPFHGHLVVAGNQFIDCFAPKLEAESFEKIESDVT